MATITNKSELNPVDADVIRSTFGAMYTNFATGESYLDNPMILEYLQYFPNVTLRMDVATRSLVPCATIPNMSILVDGNDKRKNLFSTRVKEAELPVISSEGNTNYFEITGLHQVMSAVGTRSSGKAALRDKYVEAALSAIYSELQAVMELLGKSANEFPALFGVDGVVDIKQVIETAEAQANTEWEATKKDKGDDTQE